MADMSMLLQNPQSGYFLREVLVPLKWMTGGTPISGNCRTEIQDKIHGRFMKKPGQHMEKNWCIKEISGRYMDRWEYDGICMNRILATDWYIIYTYGNIREIYQRNRHLVVPVSCPRSYVPPYWIFVDYHVVFFGLIRFNQLPIGSMYVWYIC